MGKGLERGKAPPLYKSIKDVSIKDVRRRGSYSVTCHGDSYFVM